MTGKNTTDLIVKSREIKHNFRKRLRDFHFKIADDYVNNNSDDDYGGKSAEVTKSEEFFELSRCNYDSEDADELDDNASTVLLDQYMPPRLTGTVF